MSDKDIPKYSIGGIPHTGELFIEREEGAEMVYGFGTLDKSDMEYAVETLRNMDLEKLESAVKEAVNAMRENKQWI